MNKEEYMKQLKINLKRLPKEDFNRAVEYYEEYFVEAGEENEQKAVEDLGSPREAADQIIKDMALNYSKEPVKDIKSGMNAVWIGILALFAVPIALPLLGGGIVVCLAMMLVAWSILLALMVMAASAVILGPVTIIAGFTIITKSISVFCTCIGIGLMAMGIGAAMTYGMYVLCRRFLGWTLKMLARIIRMGGKKRA